MTVWVKAIHFKIFKLVSAIWPRDWSPELGEALVALWRRQGCGYWYPSAEAGASLCPYSAYGE